MHVVPVVHSVNVELARFAVVGGASRCVSFHQISYGELAEAGFWWKKIKINYDLKYDVHRRDKESGL